MGRELGHFGLADFFAEKRRRQPSFLDAVNALLNWSKVEKIL